MLTSACPECRKRHDWPDDWAGERVDCPSCGKVMTIERPRRDRRREEDEDDRRIRRLIRRDDYGRDYGRDDHYTIVCPRCDYEGRPDVRKEMAETAWVMIVLGIFFLPLLIMGVLMKDTWEVCPDCRAKLRKIGGTTFG